MTPLVWILVILALLVSGFIAIQAIRRPILWRMAVRNASRRPRQTATVIAGLMVGTAIISAALVAGQSAGTAIRGTVYDALGPVDETVRLDSFSFYPEHVMDDFLADDEAMDYFDGISANVIWSVAAENDRTGLFEPNVNIVGFDPARDKDFRPFILQGGTRWDAADLGPNDVVINDEAAAAMEVQPGDTLTLRYTPPRDPLIPDIFPLNGNLTSVGGTILAEAGGELLEPVIEATPTTETTVVAVDRGAEELVAVLGWQPSPLPVPDVPPTTQFHLRVVAPDGTSWVAPAEPTVPATFPLVLRVEAEPGGLLQTGEWQVQVSATISVNTPYQGAVLVLYPIYDLQELVNRTGDLQEMDVSADGFLDELPGFNEPLEAQVTIAAITYGGRGDQFDLDEAMFMDIDLAQRLLDRDGEVNVIKFSNPGDQVSGIHGSERAVAMLERILNDTKADHPDDAAIQELEVFDVKRKFIQLADDAGTLMTGFLLFAGSLSVITGLLLIINIFTMLAEERRSELGMSRAVGLSRRDLIRLFLFEGSLYAVAAAAIGAILGLGLAAIMVAIINAIIGRLGSDFPPIGFSFGWDLLMAAFAAGALLTFFTIAWSSRRIARLNIVRAIRQIDEPDKVAARWQVFVGAPLAIIGYALTVLGWIQAPAQGAFTLQIFGALVVVVGMAMALRGRVRRRILDSVLAGLLLTYYTVTYFLIGEFDSINEANIVGPIRGVILTLCVVVIVAYNERMPRLLGGALSRLRSMRAVALPAVGYPQHKRFRTGMTLAMFSIVILSIGFFSIFGGLFDRPAETQTGGFHVEATTTLDVEDLSDYDLGLVPDGTITDQAHIRYFRTQDVDIITVSDEQTGHFGPPVHIVFGIEEDFVDAQEFRLLWRTEEYATDLDAYNAVLERDDVVIVSYQYSTDEQGRDLSHEVGETLTLHLGDTPRDFTIIGIQEQYHFPGIWLQKSMVEDMFPTSIRSFYMYKVAEGVDHEETAKLLERNYREVGMNAEASEVLVAEEQAAFRQILGAMKLFLGLGLIVGVLSLGIVTARSVIERRQEIGMLRALGYTRTMIRRIFVTEVTLTVVLGAIIGIACSILVSFGLWWAIIRELQYPYTIPWSEIFILLGISYVVALLATFGPIRRASRVAPAEALRYIE